jgi:PAS domain S-box-containing protein
LPEQHSNWVSLLESAAQLAASSIAVLAKSSKAEEPREEIFLTLLQKSSAAIFIRDKEGRFLWANQAYATALQTNLHQIVGRLVQEVWPAPFLADQKEADQRVLSTGQAEDRLEQWPSPTGMRTCLTQRIPLRDRWGQVFGLAGWSSDITLWLAAQDVPNRTQQSS